MRLIDAEDLDEKAVQFSNTSIWVPIEAIWNAPTIDAVPVVRCKDYINWDKEKLYCHHPAGMSFCGKKGANEGFCCFGERKDGEA